MDKQTLFTWMTVAGITGAWIGCDPAADDNNQSNAGAQQTNANQAAMQSESGSQPRTATAASGAQANASANTADNEEMAAIAIAHLNPTSAGQASGTVRFIPEEDGVRVVADLTGLPPGKHGFHIHEKGDCSAPDASSAGGHFNPTGAPHGSPQDEEHHVGDLGNVVADEMGRVALNRVYEDLALEGEASILGRGVIVHQGEDDLTSQPSGDAGVRLACGVIAFQP